MEIRRKVFSLLEDENGEERYYSTNEFEIEFDEETGEKLFSEAEGAKKGFVWVKDKFGNWVQVSKKAIGKAWEATKEAGKKAIDATKETGKKAVEATKEAGKKVVEATKEVGKKAVDATKEAGKKAIEKGGDAVKWGKNHPVAATGIVAGTAAVGTGAVLGAKAIKKHKENK